MKKIILFFYLVGLVSFHTQTVFTMNKENSEQIKQELGECGICLEVLEQGAKSGNKPIALTCKKYSKDRAQDHTFHTSCIKSWFTDEAKKQKLLRWGRCPICKTEVPIEDFFPELVILKANITKIDLSNQWISGRFDVIEFCRCKDIDPAEIKELNLNNNLITKIKNFDQLINLKILFLMNNKLITFNANNLTSLEVLYLNSNKITNMKNSDQLTKLEELGLCDNQLMMFDANRMTKLIQLGLGKNKITLLKNFDQLINLKILSFYENQLTTFDANKMINLEELDLMQNKIATLKNFDQLTRLKKLALKNNRLPIEVVKDIKKQYGAIQIFFIEPQDEDEEKSCLIS